MPRDGCGTGGRRPTWRTSSAAAEQLVRQYDGYKPFPDLAVNGQLTLAREHGRPRRPGRRVRCVARVARREAGARVAGLTGDQQLFLELRADLAQQVARGALRQQVLTDGHSPGQYRALTVRNIDAWYDAFDVKPGEALYLAPGERVRIW